MANYLENQYTPSLSSKRFQDCAKPREEVLKQFLRASKNATMRARQTYKCRQDVRYGGENDNQLLDIYFKHHEEGTPIFVYIHGGFWQELNKSTSGPLVHTLIEENYRILLVDYNLCPLVTLQQLTEQIYNFFQWLQNYAAQTKAPKISICGHSAGAHLSLQIFNKQLLPTLSSLKAIDQVFLISGLYDLRELRCLHSCNPNNVLDLNAERAFELSPLLWSYSEELLAEYRKRNMKIQIIVAENDSECFKKQSQSYYEMLKKLNLDAVYKELEGYDHFDIIEECANKNSAISNYIRSTLQL